MLVGNAAAYWIDGVPEPLLEAAESDDWQQRQYKRQLTLWDQPRDPWDQPNRPRGKSGTPDALDRHAPSSRRQ